MSIHINIIYHISHISPYVNPSHYIFHPLYFPLEELVFISLLAACYTLFEAGHAGSAWRWEGATAALAKSSLVAFSSVFCEHTYKSNSFLVVLALQASLKKSDLSGGRYSGWVACRRDISYVEM